MTAKEARRFLDNYYVKGNKVLFVVAGGKEIWFKDMTDGEAIHYATEIKAHWLPKQKLPHKPYDAKIIHRDIN